MKKTIISLAAIASLVACSNEEIMEVAPQTPIAFGNSFVENTTRAIDATLNSSNLEGFKVYGSVSGTGTGEGTVNIYNGVDVKKKSSEAPNGNAVIYNDTWWYDGEYTQYWITGNNYQFAAIVNGTATTFTQDANTTNNMPTSISYNAENQKDLLYAEWSVNNYQPTTGNDVVSFTFDHLLSKVQFTFENTITTNTANIMYTYRVSDIKINNAYMQGTYYITAAEGHAAGSWDVTTGGREGVEFGHITDATTIGAVNTAIQVGTIGTAASATSHHQRLLIPATYDDMNITCKIETLLNGVVVDTEETHTINPTSITLEAGHAYNFIIEKGAPGELIKFSVTKVNQWNPATGGTDTPIDPQP